MRSNLLLGVLGIGLLAYAAAGTAGASGGGYCSGTVLVTGGGSGGGIICVPVSPCETCDVATYSVGDETYRWCICSGGSTSPLDLCCTIVWGYDDGDKEHFSGTVGSCQDPDPPCPIPGTCEDVPNGSQHTAVCE